ncbi:MAG: malto-oligosyltrehalose synthase [Candidatus Dormibacteria bacterium]
MTPRATYRLQLQPGFGFAEATAVLDYLAALGVSHVYFSPYLQAAAGSTHGYDVVDPTRVSVELGGDLGHRALCDRLAELGLGQVLDIVPNHMSTADPRNRLWWDVLEDGPLSPIAKYFDIDWDAEDPELRNRVLLPALGQPLEEALEQRLLSLVRAPEGLSLRYFEHLYPLSPATWLELLAEWAGDDPQVAARPEVGGILRALTELPSETSDSSALVHRQVARRGAQETLRLLLDADEELAAGLDEQLRQLSGDRLRVARLVTHQNYIPAFWRDAVHRVSYRRFFDINDLVGVRVEDPVVFEATHHLLLEITRRGELDGLRIDHVDGLADPAGYLRRLRDRAGESWLVVEKILGRDEELRPDWPVDGTTGYEFAAVALAILVNDAGEAPLRRAFEEFTGDHTPYAAQARSARAEVLNGALAGDLARLGRLAALAGLGDDTATTSALAELLISMPVYRTYIDGAEVSPSAADQAVLESALEQATAAVPELRSELEGLVASLLNAGREATSKALATRFQQVSAALMAKGIEDTAFYRYLPLAALNEVGGSPGLFALDPGALHAFNQRAADTHPAAMLSTSTHDSKRGEDVRARLAVLSEIPGEWAAAVTRWHDHNLPLHTTGTPDRAMEYLFYQVLVGAWPIDAERLAGYMEKASREARVRTSWETPDAAYDEALREFVEGVMADATFIAEVAAFVAGIVVAGRVNSLALTLLKLTSPGVPDIYQGSELWNLDLVDPDNRRPVDFEVRRRMLDAVDGESACSYDSLAADAAGASKLHLTHRLLRLRATRPAIFGAGSSYAPVPARGPRQAHAIAYRRGNAGEGAVAVATRHWRGFSGRWGETEIELPGGRWTDILAGATHEAGWTGLGEVLGTGPVAVLVQE